jgi:DNA polymerase-3 subunit delta
MKLAPRDVGPFLSRPHPGPGVLIYGADAMRVTLKRRDFLAACLGADAERDMRLERVDAGELRRSAAPVVDALKARGFFPGARGVLVEEANDGVVDALAAALDAWREGDALVVVTAGELKPASKLRKLFEGHAQAVAAPVYDDPPSRAEMEAELKRAGLTEIDRDAAADLEALAQALSPGDLRQTLEKAALYKHGDPTPLTPADLAAVAPATYDTALDTVIAAAAEGDKDRVVPLLRRVAAQGTTPVTLVIAATRHFRALHDAACDPRGPDAALGRQRPPVFGPRRRAMAAQAQRWGVARLETALAALIEADMTLRSTQAAPDSALVERLFIRLAMQAGRARPAPRPPSARGRPSP